MELYTVDRTGGCTAGSEMVLQPALYNCSHLHVQNLQAPEEISATLAHNFPAGLTAHGTRYLLEPFQFSQGLVQVSGVIELIFELVRSQRFTDKPSRYSSIFGAESVSTAQNFRQEFGLQHHRIFKVKCDNYFVGDMRLANIGASAASCLNLAEKYWNGEASDNPMWEVVMVPPVKVLELIEPAS